MRVGLHKTNNHMYELEYTAEKGLKVLLSCVCVFSCVSSVGVLVVYLI